MKTSYPWYAFLFVLGGIAMLAAQDVLFVKATGQQPTPKLPAPAVRTVQVDGKGVTEYLADGTVIHRTNDGRILQSFSGNVALGGDRLYVQQPVAISAETMKLMQEEIAAAQEAQKLAADYRAAESDGDQERIKTELRQKLTAIFDLQQKRRASEIEQIQTRLKKLEATLSKRDAAKKEIVERRAEVLTGGIDELGWEDTFRGPGAQRFEPIPAARYGTPSSPIHSPGPAVIPPSRNPQYNPQPTVPPATTLPPSNTPATPVPNRDGPELPAAPADAAPPAIPRTTTGR